MISHIFYENDIEIQLKPKVYDDNYFIIVCAEFEHNEALYEGM